MAAAPVALPVGAGKAPALAKTDGDLSISLSKLDAVRTLVAMLVMLTISHVHQNFPIMAKFRPALLLAGCAVLAAIANRGALRADHLWKTKPPKYIAGLGIMACVSMVLGISFGGSASFIVYEYSKVLILAFLLVLSIRNSKDLLVFVWSYVIAAGVLSYLSIFVFRMSQPSDDGLSRISSGYAFDANDIGLVVLIGFALSLLTFQSSRKTGRMASVAIMIGIGMTLAKTGSRGAFLGMIALALAVILLVRGVSMGKRLAFLAAPALALAITAPPGYWDQMNTILSPKEDYNWTSEVGRKFIAKRGIAYMMKFPVAGVGIENFARAEGTISERAKGWMEGMAGIRWIAPHNSFVQAAAEMGVPGIVLFVCLIGSVIVLPITIRRRMPKSWGTGDQEQRFLFLTTSYLPVSGVAFAVSGFFVSFAWLDPIYILGAFAAGLTACVNDRLERDRITVSEPTASGHVVVDDVRSGSPEWRSRRWAAGLGHAR